MLQRIQTIYLLMVIICMVLTFVFPITALIPEEQIPVDVFLRIDNFPILSAIIAFVTLLTCVIIFLYKKRKLQVQLCWFSNVLIILFYALFFFLPGFENLSSTFQSIKIGVVFPLIGLIFNILAILFIKKDEKLIRSLDRIR